MFAVPGTISELVNPAVTIIINNENGSRVNLNLPSLDLSREIKMRQFLSLMLGFLIIAPCTLFAMMLRRYFEIPGLDCREWRNWSAGHFRVSGGSATMAAVMPPQAYACKDHGGGYQHGEWSTKTLELRQQGYLVANVLAGLDADAWVDDPGFRNLYAQILIERFLISADDGWIMRRALFYRGAIQEEDERAAARALLTEMSSRDYWIGPGFAALRTGVRLLPHGGNSASIQKVRQVSASLSDQDNGFKPLRAKIHGSPGAEDAAVSAEYAAGLATEAQRQPYLELADEIDAIYQAEPLETELDNKAERYTAAPWLQDMLRAAARALRNGGPGASRYITTSQLLADLREALPRIESPSVRLDILDLSLRVEVDNFSAASALRSELEYRKPQAAWQVILNLPVWPRLAPV